MSPSTLETIAARWVPGSGPVIVRPRATGLVNRSCRVDRDGRAYALRVAAPDADDLGLDRQWECRVLRHAAAAGLAPRVEQCLPQQGIVVAAWLSGRVWPVEATGRAGTLDAVAQLLRRVHALPIPQPARVMGAGSWIDHYTKAAVRHGCGRSTARPHLRDTAARRLTELTALGAAAPVLCHSDVHRLNILRAATGGRVMLLDWEYAHVSDGLWDVAGWVANNDLGPAQGSRLLGSYLGRPAEPAEMRRLQLIVWLYDYVCLLWSAVYARLRTGEEAAAVSTRAAIIAARLARRVGSRAG